MVERPRDEIWDTLVELYGEVSNANARGRRNKAVQLLKESGATPDEMRKRFENYPVVMGNAQNTDIAFATNWDKLDAAVQTRSLVAQTFNALWPRSTFDEAGWRAILKGIPRDEIVEALTDMGMVEKFPPGAGHVRRYIIDRRLGQEAPPSPKAAYELAVHYRQELQSGLSAPSAIPEVVKKAVVASARAFSEATFIEAYNGVLIEFYRGYDFGS